MTNVSVNNIEHTVTATRVAEERRLAFLPRHFGPRMLQVENYLYNRFRTLCNTYRGGYWAFYDLSNGGCYLAPHGEHFRLQQPNNYFDGSVSGDAAGIIVTLYTMSELSFQYEHEEIFATRFHQLREFATEHAEGGSIFAAID